MLASFWVRKEFALLNRFLGLLFCLCVFICMLVHLRVFGCVYICMEATGNLNYCFLRSIHLLYSLRGLEYLSLA